MLRMIIQDLKISPLRNALTALSMFIGVVAIVASVLVGSIGGEYLEATNAQLSGKPVTYAVHIADTSAVGAEDMYGLARALDSGQGIVTAIASSPSTDMHYRSGAWEEGDALDGILGTDNRPSVDGDSGGAMETLLVSSRYSDIYKLPVVQGRWLSPAQSLVPLELVLNKPAYEELGIAYDAEGVARVQVSTAGSTDISTGYVVGVVNDGMMDPRVYADVAGIATFLPRALPREALELVAHTPTRSEDVQAVRLALADVLSDTVSGKIDDIIRIDNSEYYRKVLSFLQRAFAIAGLLLLITSAIGLLNVGLASIDQRSRELLIRRALGATRASLVALVLGEMLLIAAIVCVVALVCVIALVAAVPALLPVDTPVSAPRFPSSAAVMAIASCAVTAIVGAIIPALKAAHLEPALVLR